MIALLAVYLTIDVQRRFYIYSYKSNKMFRNLSLWISQRISEFGVIYDFGWDMIGELELSFREIIYLSNKPKKPDKSYKDSMDNRTFSEVWKQFNLFEPVLEEELIDIPMNIVNGKIDSMEVNMDRENDPDFLLCLNEQNYYLKPEQRIDLNDNVDNSRFGQKFIDKERIVMKIEKLSELEVKKYAFSLDGKLLGSTKDELLSDGRLKRSWGDDFVIYKDGEIVERSKKYTFDPVKLEIFYKNKNIFPLANPKIGSFDMEVFIQNHESKIYALGFYSFLDIKPKMFYIDETLDSDINVLFLIIL